MVSERGIVLGDVSELVRGVSYHPTDLLNDGSNAVPLLRATNIGNSILDLFDVLYVPSALVRESQYLRRFDVVIAMSSGSRQAVGRLAQLRQDWTGCVGAFCGVIRPDPQRVNPEYLGYVLLSSDFRTRIETYAVGTAIMNLSRERVLGFSLRLPEFAEQRAIAHILGTLDDKIELNRRMSETLEAMARALFKSWFVDFDPVRIRRGGPPWPPRADTEVCPYMTPAILDLFPARLVDSELGEIPEGWGVAPMPALIDINPPRRLSKGAIAPYLDMANMPTHGHSPDEVVDRPFNSGMRFVNGDTLVARITPCLENGKTAFVDFLLKGQVGWGSTEYIVLRPKPPLPEEFAYCLARTHVFREFAIQSMTGTSGRQRVQPESLAHFQLPRVPSSVTEAFGRTIKPLFARSSAAVRESRTLVALRDSLLPKLISGALRVRDAERFLKECDL